MRAKRITASVLSFAICAGSVTSAAAYAEDKLSTASTASASAELSGTASSDNAASVVTIKLGDINDDGLIDAADASSALAAYTKLSSGLASGFTPTQAVAADVNMDGITDAVDASAILSYYAYVSTMTALPLSIEAFLNEKTETTTSATTTILTTTTTTAAAKTTAKTTSSAATSSKAAGSSTTSVSKTTTSAAPATTSTASTTARASATSVTAVQTTTAKASSATSASATSSVSTASSATSAAASASATTTTTAADPSKVSSISLSVTELTLNVGEGGISMVSMLPATADKTERWKSSDEHIASVNYEGWITGLSEGICTVTVESVSNPDVKADIQVTVIDPTRVREIKLSKTELTIPVGEGNISMVTMLPDNAMNKGEVWISSDENIAVVGEDGWITGMSPGNCIVTVISKSNPDVKAEIKVKVTDPKRPIAIKLSKYELDLLAGTLDISFVKTLPETADPINEVWKSSDVSIANVDKWGNVYGVSAGTCTITVSSADYPDIKEEIKVTVHSRPVITSEAAATTTTTTTTTTTVTTTTTTASTSVTTTAVQAFTATAPTTHLISSYNGATYVDGILIVNKSYSISKDFAADGLNANAAEQFRLLSEDAAKLGLSIVCSSGFRSYDDQEKIYSNYVAIDGVQKADTYSARAGHSEHQTGLAIDVNSISDDFIDTPECEWLAQNAHKYGFIIRYPQGKEAYTGYRYEPWHIRYLGVETAEKVYESGLSLEEYLGIDSYYR